MSRTVQTTLKYCLLLIGLLLPLIPSAAQAIVNVEELRSASDGPLFKGQVDLSASGTTGNSDQVSVHTGMRLHWQRTRHDNLLIIDRSYGKSNGIRNINKAFLHFRHGQHVSGRRTLEGFVQMESNEFSRMAFRGLAGTGVRLRLGNSDKNRNFLGLGVFHEWEQIEKDPTLNEKTDSTFWRFNQYLVLNYAFNERIRLVNTLYYQPKFSDIDDYRLLEEASVIIHLTDRLDLKQTLEIVHDSRPALTVEQTDTSYTTSLRYKF